VFGKTPHFVVVRGNRRKIQGFSEIYGNKKCKDIAHIVIKKAVNFSEKQSLIYLKIKINIELR